MGESGSVATEARRGECRWQESVAEKMNRRAKRPGRGMRGPTGGHVNVCSPAPSKAHIGNK